MDAVIPAIGSQKDSHEPEASLDYRDALTVCISYSPAVVIKQPSQDNLRKKVLLAYSSRGEGVIRIKRDGSRSRKLKAPILKSRC